MDGACSTYGLEDGCIKGFGVEACVKGATWENEGEVGGEKY